jgi:hypothetical protein
MSDDYTLAYGTHASPTEGRCAMEWVSHLAGEPHSDQPRCVSPVLRALCVALNDGLEYNRRQQLRPYLTRTIGTAEDGLDVERAWLALDWLLREYLPTWLTQARLEPEAIRLAGLDPVLDERSLRRALSAVNTARSAARERRTAGTLSVARSVAREQAWSCAGGAAWAAARLGIGDMNGDRARAAARSAAADAATIAAEHALQLAGRAAGRAGSKTVARSALAPTAERLTVSLFGLLDRMLPLEPMPIMDTIGGDAAAVFTTSV